jgi:hypothetical protein
MANLTQWAAAQPHSPIISLEHDFFPIASSQIPEAIKTVLNVGYAVKPVCTCPGLDDAYYSAQLLEVKDGNTKTVEVNSGKDPTQVTYTPTGAHSAAKSNRYGINVLGYFRGSGVLRL